MGATGRAGARVVRELLKKGFKVKAAVRNMEAAKQVRMAAAAQPSMRTLTK